MAHVVAGSWISAAGQMMGYFIQVRKQTAMDEHLPTTKLVENWKFLLVVTIGLILIAYTIPVSQMFIDPPSDAKGFGEGKLW